MRRAITLVPLLGALTGVSVPLMRHFEQRRHERVAIEVLREVQAAQEQLRRKVNGYAADVASLIAGCPDNAPQTGSGWPARLEEAGYVLIIRPAAGAQDAGPCGSRRLAADYYASVEPRTATALGQQAFAARAGTGIYLFYDGIAPTEQDIGRGLATPLEQRSTYRIP